MTDSKPKKWYQKKAYIISSGIGLLFVIGAFSDSAHTPTPSPVTPPTVSVASGVEPETVQRAVAAEVENQKPIDASGSVYVPLSNDNYYTNSAGEKVHSPAYADEIPPGASARCRDGTYSFSQSRRGTCSHHGGVAQWL